ncbi:hypothetical protein ACFOWE_17010 [Planomonospora corallina]|uniref:Mce-associated membrane protein n=1 Tax=Planomonospora corallina TaxID=1806052 RepID=A0ABV8IAC9_9ACTN
MSPTSARSAELSEETGADRAGTPGSETPESAEHMPAASEPGTAEPGTAEPAASGPGTSGPGTPEAGTSGPGASAADGGGADGGTGARVRPAWWKRPAGAVAATAVAGAVAFGAVQWISAERLADRLAAEKDERLAVSATAGEFAAALQTYDHTDLQSYRDRVFSLSGEEFEKAYDEAFSPLESVITAMRASSTASVRGVYVSEVADGRAKAVTVVDSQVRSTSGTKRMLGAYMQLSLVEIGGEWKVSDATVLGAADELLTGSDGKPAEPSASPGPDGKKDGKKDGKDG